MFEEKTKNNEFNFDIDTMAKDCMEFARKYHEQYLIKGNKSDLENAVDNYIDAIKFNPRIPEAYYRLASLLWDKGEINLSSAIKQCKEAISIAPENPNARIYAAYFLELAKKYDEAEAEFKKAINLNPLKSARSRLSLVSLYFDKMKDSGINASDVSKSLYYMFSGGLSIALDYPSIRMLYKNAAKNISLAMYSFFGNILEATKNYSMAVKAYDAAASKTGQNGLYYQKIGDINVREDEIKEARTSYLKALNSNPYNKDLLVKVATISQIYFEDDIDTAIDCYTKLLELETNNAQIYYELGHLYLKKEDFINSINAFNLALEKDSKNPFYHNAIAYALIRAEQYEEAAEHYKYAISQNPDSEWTAIVCQALASLYFNVFEDVDTAMDLLKEAIILDDNNDESYIELGNIYLSLDDEDSAIKSYCEAIKRNPQNPAAYNKCAMSLWQKNYVEEAVIAYNKAISICPDYAPAYNNLGVIYLDGIRNLKEAKTLFETAISLKNDYTLAHFNLGRVLEADGNKVEAAKCYQKAIELNKDSQELNQEEISEKLYKLFEV